MSERPVALVTGAAHGQGRAVSVALAGAGYDIVALDVAKPLAYPGYAMGTPAELASLEREIGALIAVADVRDDAQVLPAVDAAIERFGRIDLLFNNAGICAYGLAHELSEDEWDAMIDINLKGAWIVARRVIPHMITVGPHRPHEVVGDRARPARHPRELDPPDGRRHAAQRRARRAGGADHARGGRAVGGQPAAGAVDRAAGRRRAVLYLADARYVTGTTLVIDAGLLTK
jgi:NAD(P)-dependent dehydrogenase (short-subunit alcohol dehydrogenase family)